MVKNIAIAVLIFLVGGMAWYITDIQKEQYLQTVDETSTSTASAKEETTPSQLNTSKPAPQKSCSTLAREAIEKNGTEYERGSILVSFTADVSFEDAQAIVTREGLSVKAEGSTRSEFNSLHFLTVVVPKGKEFEWICVFKAKAGVKNASVNPLFKLHQ